MSDDFVHTSLPVLGARIHRLGLSCGYGIDDDSIRWALEEAGLNHVFWSPRQKGQVPVRDRLKTHRDQMVVMTGPTTARWKGNLNRFVDKARKMLDVDQLDILMLFWLGVTSNWTRARIDDLVALKENLAGLENGRLSQDEMTWMREYGKIVHG